MQLDQITPVILTWNEEPNLRRCLERLRWAKEVVILDSGSTDATAAIAAEYPNTRLLERPFDDHTQQWNFGVGATSTNWVLSLDCDYVLCLGFEDELARLDEATPFDAFCASFRYLVFGMPLRACLYPPRAVLFQKDRCFYVEDGHTQILQVNGTLGHLKTKIDHDDRKPLTRWLSSQDKYAHLEAEKLSAADPGKLRLQDRLRRSMWAAVPSSLVYTLLVKGTLWDGWRGWYYALQRMLAEMLLALRLIERRFKP